MEVIGIIESRLEGKSRKPFILLPCEQCGKLRWVRFKAGKPASKLCRQCACQNVRPNNKGKRLGKNNPMWGRKHRKDSRAKISLSHLAEKNPLWKGDRVGYGSLHEWVKRRIPKPIFCSECRKLPPKDLANKSGEYKRDLSDWEWLCRKCHMKKDGRLSNLRQFNGEYRQTNPIRFSGGQRKEDGMPYMWNGNGKQTDEPD